MARYVAVIEMGIDNFTVEGNNRYELMREIEEHQDLDCHLSMARNVEIASKQKEVDKLDDFMDRYYCIGITVEDIRNIDINFSIGRLKCHRLIDTEHNRRIGE